MENKSIYEKLIKIQSELKAPKEKTGNGIKYSYRSAEDIIEQVKPLLKEHNLILLLSDKVINIGERYYMEATVKITDGKEEIITSAMAREPETQAGISQGQLSGATSSYARKYALGGLFCIDDSKDLDGLHAEGKINQEKTKKQQQPQQNEAESEIIDSDLEITLNECKTEQECKDWFKIASKDTKAMAQLGLGVKYQNKLKSLKK